MLGGGSDLLAMSTLSPTIVKDALLDLSNPLLDGGSNVSGQIASNAGGTVVKRTLFDFGNLISLGIPAGSVINSATLTLNVTGAPASASLAVEWNLMTRKTWLEGTGAGDGCSWTYYDLLGLGLWTTAGGDYTTTGHQATENLPTTTGLKAFDLTTFVATALANGGDCNFIGRRTTESGAGTLTFDSAQGTTPPTLSINYTSPSVFMRGQARMQGGMKELLGNIGG